MKRIINWLRSLFFMNTYTFTDSKGVAHEFQTSATLPLDTGTIAQPGNPSTQGGGGPGPGSGTPR